MTTTSTGAAPSGAASGRSRAKAAANGKRTLTLRGLKLTIRDSVPVGTLRAAFKEEATNADVIQFLVAALGEEQMEQVWAIDLDLGAGPIVEQVDALLGELQTKVQKALGLELGESDASSGR